MKTRHNILYKAPTTTVMNLTVEKIICKSNGDIPGSGKDITKKEYYSGNMNAVRNLLYGEPLKPSNPVQLYDVLFEVKYEDRHDTIQRDSCWIFGLSEREIARICSLSNYELSNWAKEQPGFQSGFYWSIAVLKKEPAKKYDY